jgi:hypothetical protein
MASVSLSLSKAIENKSPGFDRLNLTFPIFEMVLVYQHDFNLHLYHFCVYFV